MSHNVPPASSENVRPEINLSLLNSTRNTVVVPPKGIFSKKGPRKTLESSHWGNAPFFPNAKPASMLERGWILSTYLTMQKGVKGLIKQKDGRERKVEVIKEFHEIEVIDTSGNIIKDTSGNIITDNVCSVKDIHTGELLDFSYHYFFTGEWEFYLPTTPVPFIPRRQNVAQEWIKSDYLKMKKGVQGLIKVKDGPEREREVEVIKEFDRIEVMDASGNLIKDTVCSVKDIKTNELLNFSMGKHFLGKWDFYIRNPLRKGGSKKRKVKKGKKTRSKRK